MTKRKRTKGQKPFTIHTHKTKDRVQLSVSFTSISLWYANNKWTLMVGFVSDKTNFYFGNN